MFVGASKKKTTTQNEKPLNNDQIIEANEQFILNFIENRDYSGASTFIEFLRDELQQPYTREMALWNGYSLFHLGKYSEAIEIYEKLLEEDSSDLSLNLYISSCHFYNGDYELAQDSVMKGPNCDLKTRLLFHIAQHRHDDQQLFQAHSAMTGTLENQLSLAAIHYTRSNFQDAIELYQKIIAMFPNYLAIYVYIAMCQFKLDQFEECNDSVDQYLAENSDSAVSLNLKSCAYLRLFGTDVAESQLLQIQKFASATYNFIDALIKHNEVIFHNGDDGFTVLTKLINSLPEARFNLAVLHLRKNEPEEAYNISQEIDPLDINESILKATVSLAMGQVSQNTTLIEEANNSFSEIGQMDIIKDTVPGRECLATSKFIEGDYSSSLSILQTIEEVVGEIDEFNYNKGMALAALARYSEAEKYLLKVSNETYTREIYYVSWLCKCYIKNNKAEKAFNLYLMASTTEDANVLLQIISTECFIIGEYYYAMKAYDVISQFDIDSSTQEGLVASAIGVFRAILARKETPEKIIDVLTILNRVSLENPEIQKIYLVIQEYVDSSDEFNITGY